MFKYYSEDFLASCVCYCKSPKIGKSYVLPVNPIINHSEVVKVRKMLVNASIVGF
jgi:hypothetical protein